MGCNYCQRADKVLSKSDFCEAPDKLIKEALKTLPRIEVSGQISDICIDHDFGILEEKDEC